VQNYRTAALSSQITDTYEMFCQIKELYIEDNAPYPVNISYDARQGLLCTRHENFLNELSFPSQVNIFDVAYAELEELFWTTLLNLPNKVRESFLIGTELRPTRQFLTSSHDIQHVTQHAC